MLYSPNFIIFCNFGTKIGIILDLMILDFKLKAPKQLTWRVYNLQFVTYKLVTFSTRTKKQLSI